MKFRKKPVEIEARPFDGTAEGAQRLVDWIGGEARMEQHDASGIASLVIVIPTLEGNMIASKSDWIIRGVKGEFYPCKPDIFKQTYEAVRDDET